MRIISLVDDVSCDITGFEHGLSLYIETKEKKILFDMGQSDLFFQNSLKKGIDLTKVDLAILSHGHYDHGGGLKTFLSINNHALVYVNSLAFQPHYRFNKGDIKDIGIDASLKNHPQIVLTKERLDVDSIHLFSGVKGKRLLSETNQLLYMGKLLEHKNDDFMHEQNLIIEEDGKTVLITGCAHKGIVNIMDEAKELGFDLEVIVGGFHFLHMSVLQYGELMDNVAAYLNKSAKKIYAAHCTGTEPYLRMKQTLQDKIDYLSCGKEIEI